MRTLKWYAPVLFYLSTVTGTSWWRFTGLDLRTSCSWYTRCWKVSSRNPSTASSTTTAFPVRTASPRVYVWLQPRRGHFHFRFHFDLIYYYCCCFFVWVISMKLSFVLIWFGLEMNTTIVSHRAKSSHLLDKWLGFTKSLMDHFKSYLFIVETFWFDARSTIYSLW